MTHPHLEGHIQKLREMFAVCANERRMQEADALNAAIAALAALPGGGVDAGAAYDKGWIECASWACRRDLISDMGSEAYAKDKRSNLSPTPPPHEADQ